MKAIYHQSGTVIDFINTTTSDIEANEIVVLTNRIGVAATAIPVGGLGAINVVGVYTLPAEASVAFTVGQKLYFSGGKVTATEGDVVAGYAIADKTQAANAVNVKIS